MWAEQQERGGNPSPAGGNGEQKQEKQEEQEKELGAGNGGDAQNGWGREQEWSSPGKAPPSKGVGQ